MSWREGHDDAAFVHQYFVAGDLPSIRSCQSEQNIFVHGGHRCDVDLNLSCRAVGNIPFNHEACL